MSRPITQRSQTRFARMRRQFGFDRNELRRGIDLTQWKVGVTLSLVLLIIAPSASPGRREPSLSPAYRLRLGKGAPSTR